MTSQGDIPVMLMRAAVRFDVAESNYLLLQHYGVYSLNSLAFKIPKSEDMETFLQERMLGLSAYKQEDGTVVTFPRTPAVRWGDWKLSDDAASLRRLWTFARETARGEMERMASSEETHRKITMVESVAMESAAIARGCPNPSSDRERPSLFTFNKVSKAMQTPGATYEVIPWEAYLSKEEEDRLQRSGKIPKSGTVELTLNQEEKLVAKGKGVDAEKHVPKVSDMENLRARLELRARSLDMLGVAKHGTMRGLSDKYYGKINSSVAAGMRNPTLNELRRFDRELQVTMFRHLSKGEGSFEEAVTYYVENDGDQLWRLLDA